QQLRQDGLLPAAAVTIEGRDYAPGDRVIARRNDRTHDIDNGTLATVIDVDRDGAMLVRTDSGQARELSPAYVADHLEYAYALTGHGAQGATVGWVAVVGRPEELTREWAYTALSRARGDTMIHLISEASEAAREREQYAPAQPDRAATQTLSALRTAMRRRETEPLALEHLHPQHRPSPPTAGPTPPRHGTTPTAADPRRVENPVTRTLEHEAAQPEPPRPVPLVRPSPGAEPDGLALLRRNRSAPGRTLSR
ncbi:MAG: hypothetical protein ACRDNK_16840, partial [Solirubrobacteraceae bacterium]